MSKKYTYEEVRRHSTPEDLWVILNGNVYDVTRFKKDHPGGEEMLFMVGGMDATETFEAVGHTEVATNLAKQYKIGEAIIPEKPKNVVDKNMSTKGITYFKTLATIGIVSYILFIIFNN